MARLSERAVRGQQLPPNVRIPLRMLTHILETDPLPTDPLADVWLRLECLKGLQRELEAERWRWRYRMSLMATPPFHVGSILALGARP